MTVVVGASTLSEEKSYLLQRRNDTGNNDKTNKKTSRTYQIELFFVLSSIGLTLVGKYSTIILLIFL